MSSLVRRIQALFATKPPESQTAEPSGPATPTVPALPLSSNLENLAKSFKQQFIANNAKYHLEGGQIAPNMEMARQLVAKVDAIKAMSAGDGVDELKKALRDLLQGAGQSEMRKALKGDAVRWGDNDIYRDLKKRDPGHPDFKKPLGVLRTFSIVNTTTTYRETTAAARRLLTRATLSDADRKFVTEMLDDKSANGDWSYNYLIKWMSDPLGPLDVTEKMSLPRVLALFLNGTVQCAPMAAATARKLYKSRGITSASTPAFPTRIFAEQPDKKVPKLRPKDEDTDPGRSTKGNLILRYNPAQLESAMQAARSLLANGDPAHDAHAGYLVAGCLSGFQWENVLTVGEKRAQPFPEHYILIFAADNDTLLFWDPDTYSTNITEFGERLGVNIGLLYYDHSDPAKPTLSTGVDFADLSTLNGGEHKAHFRRHRYQVADLVKG